MADAPKSPPRTGLFAVGELRKLYVNRNTIKTGDKAGQTFETATAVLDLGQTIQNVSFYAPQDAYDCFGITAEWTADRANPKWVSVEVRPAAWLTREGKAAAGLRAVTLPL